MFIEKQFSPRPFGAITTNTHDEHKKLYAGYVKNANAVLEKINALRSDESRTYELGELYRHFSFEFDGMRNHECYFALLEGAATGPIAEGLGTAIATKWQSFDAWKAAFVDLAANTRGIGWATLSFDTESKTLLMHWVDEQHLGQLQGTHPILALDMWEHSYVADYQPSGKKRYVTDWVEAIDWTIAEKRYQHSLAAAQ
jgi:Fe-Mn family superoxide dismutase